jgi:hypothetical protein
MTTFGEISWEDDSVGGGKKNTNNKDLWLRLDEGSNELRLVTQPFQYLVHKYKKDENDKRDFGKKVSCSAINGSCVLCDAGDQAKPRWLLGVISRKSGTYKILDISYAVFSQIRKLAKNTQRWGDPTKYDLDIVVDKNGGPTGYYSVQPISKEPLSAEDQVLKDSADLDELKFKVTPPSPETVIKIIAKLNGADGSTPAATASAKKPVVAKTVKPAPVSMSDDEDDDLDGEFPSYDSK